MEIKALCPHCGEELTTSLTKLRDYAVTLTPDGKPPQINCVYSLNGDICRKPLLIDQYGNTVIIIPAGANFFAFEFIGK